jgi:hypothetical protein
MPIEDLPKPIQEMILNQSNFSEYEPMPNTYAITEILGCLRQKFFQKTLPKRPITIETAINFYRGNLWDKNFTGLFKRNQIRSTYRCRSLPICISGKFDFLYEGTITDLKSPASLFYVKNSGKPSETYRKQVLFYCYTNAQTKGQVMYWDGHECLKYPVEVTEEKCAELIEEIESRTMILWTSIHNKKAPNKILFPPESWMCKCCEFVEECNSTC